MNSTAAAKSLVALYATGLRMPLHFFPKSSWCFVRKGSSAATNAWQSSAFRRFGEDRHAAYRLCLRGVDNPLDDAFERCATTVLEPLLAFIDDDRLAP